MRYWDFSLPSAEVHPTSVSKFNTALQLVVIGAALTVPALSNDLLAPIGLTTDQLGSALIGMSYVVAGTTLWSGGSYVWRKDVVKILGDDEALKKKQGFRGRAILGVSLASFVILAGVLAARQQNSSQDSDPTEEI
jgi:cardiolipin synthase